MSIEILDCLKRKRDIFIITSQNTAFMLTAALRVFRQKKSGMTGDNGVVLELLPFRGEKIFKPRLQHRLLVPLIGTS